MQQPLVCPEYTQAHRAVQRRGHTAVNRLAHAGVMEIIPARLPWSRIRRHNRRHDVRTIRHHYARTVHPDRTPGMSEAVHQAVAVLRAGGLVALPTETPEP